MTYELWDVGSGNIIGTFTSEDDALDVVRSLLDSFGTEYADELDLGKRDASGARHAIASGEELADLASRTVGRRAGIV